MPINSAPSPPEPQLAAQSPQFPAEIGAAQAKVGVLDALSRTLTGCSGCGCLLLVILALASLLFFGGCPTHDTNGGKSKPDNISAFVMSKEFVKEQLRAPSTADFPWYEKSFVTDLGGGRFRVSAYVDAQNSFGAKLRSNYTCVLGSTDGDTWIVESINID